MGSGPAGETLHSDIKKMLEALVAMHADTEENHRVIAEAVAAKRLFSERPPDDAA